MATLQIPDVLKKFTNSESIPLPEITYQNLPTWIKETYPSLHQAIYRGDRLHGFLNLYVNDEPMTTTSPAQLIPENATLRLVASISGG
ncbi:MAG: hypothetical protein EBX40_00730 [Gammaproteobacteria bacterium]|nr:hypothetical protein [Gammaproteobacteria bacterium]